MKTLSHWGSVKAGSRKMNEGQIHSRIVNERIDSRIFTKGLHDSLLKKKHAECETNETKEETT